MKRCADDEVRTKYRSEPQNNIDFDNGPWLKPQVAATRNDNVTLKLTSKSVEDFGGERLVKLKAVVANAGTIPLFPCKLDIDEDKTLSYASDNYFFLLAGSSRDFELTVRVRDDKLNAVTLSLTCWNADRREVEIRL